LCIGHILSIMIWCISDRHKHSHLMVYNYI
jgi:hypothetical protein